MEMLVVPGFGGGGAWIYGVGDQIGMGGVKKLFHQEADICVQFFSSATES